MDMEVEKKQSGALCGSGRAHKRILYPVCILCSVCDYYADRFRIWCIPGSGLAGKTPE